MNRVIKVDRVKSVEESAIVQQLGATHVTVDFTSGKLFDDDRLMEENVAIAIRAKLDAAQFGGHFVAHDRDIDTWLALVQRCRLDFVQISKYEIPDVNIRRQLLAMGCKIVYAEIGVANDDDPSWILSDFREMPDVGALFYQLELLADLDDSWAFLRHECPKYPDEIQVEDIDKLAQVNSILISLDYKQSNVREILTHFKNIGGISMTLGTLRPNCYQVHALQFPELVEVLKASRASGET